MQAIIEYKKTFLRDICYWEWFKFSSEDVAYMRIEPNREGQNAIFWNNVGEPEHKTFNENSQVIPLIFVVGKFQCKG
jgi:hypothetical protein